LQFPAFVADQNGILAVAIAVNIAARQKFPGKQPTHQYTETPTPRAHSPSDLAVLVRDATRMEGVLQASCLQWPTGKLS